MCSATGIATFESLILCPFERLRTYFMTVEKASTKTSFIGYFKGSERPVKDLFRGFGSLYMR